MFIARHRLESKQIVESCSTWHRKIFANSPIFILYCCSSYVELSTTIYFTVSCQREWSTFHNWRSTYEWWVFCWRTRFFIFFAEPAQTMRVREDDEMSRDIFSLLTCSILTSILPYVSLSSPVRSCWSEKVISVADSDSAYVSNSTRI